MSDLDPLTLDEIEILLGAAEVAQIPGQGHYAPAPDHVARLCRDLQAEHRTTEELRIEVIRLRDAIRVFLVADDYHRRRPNAVPAGRVGVSGSDE